MTLELCKTCGSYLEEGRCPICAARRSQMETEIPTSQKRKDLSINKIVVGSITIYNRYDHQEGAA